MADRGPIDELVVVIPVNDEEELLDDCLRAVDVAARSVSSSAGAVVPRIRVIVVLDDCVDRSAQIVAMWPRVESVQVGYRNVGATRAHGIRHALATSGATPARVWVASTDADSMVPPDWVSHQLALADDGVDLMIGAIRPNPGDLTAAQYRSWTGRHATDSALHVHGANLGFRADAYLAAGGFPPLAEHEDTVLVDRLRRRGAVTASAVSCWVLTSARQLGRTPGGFSAYVREYY